MNINKCAYILLFTSFNSLINFTRARESPFIKSDIYVLHFITVIRITINNN